MSNNIYTPRTNRKRAISAFAVGTLLATCAVSGVYASLATSISTEAGSEKIYNNLTFDYAWTVDSAPIVKDVTPVTAPVAEPFVKTVQNDSSVDAQLAFWVSGVDIATIPDSILDHTTVTVDNGNTYPAVLTLRQFLTQAVVFENTVPGQTDQTITVSITAPNNASAVDFKDALDFTEATFATNVTLSQKVAGVSPLVAYAETNGTYIGGNGGFSSRSYLIPVGDVATAAGL